MLLVRDAQCESVVVMRKDKMEAYMKTILVIGMGKMGQHLARKMQQLGNEVMIVDKSEQIIQELAPEFKDCFVGDCANEGVLRSLGINNFDYCFVAIGEESYASLEITSLLKELGGKCVVANANSSRQAKFLKSVGADEVFFPEKEIADKLAVRYNSEAIFDYVELTSDYAIFEVAILKQWVGKTIMHLDIRKKYHVNIIAIKKGEKIDALPGGNYAFEEGDHILVIGETNHVFDLAKASEK